MAVLQVVAIALVMGGAGALPPSDSVALAQEAANHTRMNEAIVNKPPSAAARLVAALMSICLIAPIMVASAYCFKQRQKWPEADSSIDPEGLKKWSSGLFDCLNRKDICLWAFFCPAVRWAANVEMMGFMSFWVAFAVLATLSLLDLIYVFAFIAAVASAAVLTFYRYRLRASFDMEDADTFPTVCGDCLTVTFCTCCAISQEARHVETAAAAGHQAVMMQKPLSQQAAV